jgi:hypothetical protein
LDNRTTTAPAGTAHGHTPDESIPGRLDLGLAERLHINFIPNALNNVWIGIEVSGQLFVGFQIEHKHRANHASIGIEQRPTEQELPFCFKLANVVEVGGADRHASVKSIRIRVIISVNNVLHTAISIFRKTT